MSIGARNAVSVTVAGGARPTVSSQRAVAMLDQDGTMQITGFGDLTIASELEFASGASAADLVAHTLGDIIATLGAAAERTVFTYPAVYRAQHLSALRQALAKVALGAVELVAEPVAAVAALDRITGQDATESIGDADPEAVLVYDLGATSLDLTVVVPDGNGHRIAGRPVRSHAFGGRSTAAAVAALAHDLTPDNEPGPHQDDHDRAREVRADLARQSLPLVDQCLDSAGLSARELGAVLLVGGAVAPDEIAHTLADALRCPVVRGSAPAQTVAFGAALLGVHRPDADNVLVPVRRLPPHSTLVAGALVAPLLIAAAIGSLRPDAGRIGALAPASTPDGARAPLLTTDQPAVAQTFSALGSEENSPQLLGVMSAASWRPQPLSSPTVSTEQLTESVISAFFGATAVATEPLPPIEEGEPAEVGSTDFPSVSVYYPLPEQVPKPPCHGHQGGSTPPPAPQTSTPESTGNPGTPADPVMNTPLDAPPPPLPTPDDSTGRLDSGAPESATTPTAAEGNATGST